MKKQSKKSTALLLIAAVLMIGNSAMAQSEKESKSESEQAYDNLYKNHDYSVTIKTDESKTTYFGCLNNDMMACKKNIDDTIYQYRCLIKDDNTISMVSIGFGKVAFWVPGTRPIDDKILFTNIKQRKNVVNFDIQYKDKTIAECSIELPDNETKFKQLLPLTFNSDDESTEPSAQKAAYMENVAICIFTEIFDSIKDNIAIRYRQCYQHFNETAKMGMKYGYSYKAHHPKHHDECSFSNSIVTNK